METTMQARPITVPGQRTRPMHKAAFTPLQVSPDPERFLTTAVEGHASVWGSLAESVMGPTVIERGAFTRTLAEHQDRIKILYQHDSTEPIGLPEALREDGHGLFVRARIADTVRGRDVLELVRTGVVDALSIGFDPVRFWEEGRPDGGTVRHLTEVRLWEVSFVTWGADPQARVIGVDDDRFSLTELEAEARAIKRRLDWQRRTDAGGFWGKLRRAQADLIALGPLGRPAA